MNLGDVLFHIFGQLSEWFVSGFMFTVGGFVAIALLVPLFTSSDKGKKVRDYEVLVDQDTGCQYLMTHKGGVTPRLNADGSLFCRSKAKESANE